MQEDGDSDHARSEDQHESLSTVETLRLGAARAYYSISRALQFNKVAALLQRAELSVDSPVWLLGCSYDPTATACESRQVLSNLAFHFQSCLLMTYRSGFMPLHAGGDVQLRSDAGWGCTLRVTQMMVAQALQRREFGNANVWRWTGRDRALESDEEGGGTSGTAHGEPPQNLCRLLQLFWDIPAARSTFSIHNLCTHGAAYGVFPGRWLGPWTACCALQAAAQHADPSIGLTVKVLGGDGGGAPLLYIDQFLPLFEATATVNASVDTRGGRSRGLLLLVPLVLGLGKLNPLYLPQLQAVLSMPQSVGFIGGSPGSSLYIVGFQGDAALYMDPHEVQPAACSDADCETFKGDALRTLPLLTMDPSVALGFYCETKDDYRNLCGRLSRLEKVNAGSPVVCVREGLDPGPEVYQGGVESWASDVSSSDGEAGGQEAEALPEGESEGSENCPDRRAANPERQASRSKFAWELI